MMNLFYALPIWLESILILILALVIGLASSFGLRKALGLKATEDQTEHAVSLMQVVAAYIGILIAFAGVQVWQDFSDAQNDLHHEAAEAAQLYRDLSTYGPEAVEARSAVRAYIESVVTDEWALLQQGRGSDKTEVALYRLFDAIGRIRPQDNRDSAIFSEAFDKLNDLVGLRRDRLIHSNSSMPLILWIVGLVGSVLIVSYTSTFRPNRMNVMMIAGISLALGLMFLFILIVDRPYQGSFRVSDAELRALPAKFDALDRLSAAAQANARKPEQGPG